MWLHNIKQSLSIIHVYKPDMSSATAKYYSRVTVSKVFQSWQTHSLQVQHRQKNHPPNLNSDYLLMRITLLIQPSEKVTHTLPSAKSWVPMLTTEQPMALAELRQSVWFSVLSHGFSLSFMFTALSSIVPGTATFINLLHKSNSASSLQLQVLQCIFLSVLSSIANLYDI